MRPAGRQAGYVLLASLLLAALVSSLVLTYSRHALISASNSAANVDSQLALDAADSGFAWARQSLRAGAGSAASLELGDGRSVSVNVEGTADSLRSIGVDATSSGSSQSLQATVEIYSLPGEELPELTAESRTALAATAPTIRISGSSSYTSTELTGIILLDAGSTLTLQDVVLDGSIVSESALTGSPGAVSIQLRGGVQIKPGGDLPGCAIVAPDGSLSGDGSERVQIHGAVVAGSVSLPGSGALHGELACASDPVLGAAIDRPGAGRAPRAWPRPLQTNSAGVGRLAFAGVDVREAEKTAIRGFAFPSRTTGASGPPAAPAGGP